MAESIEELKRQIQRLEERLDRRVRDLEEDLEEQRQKVATLVWVPVRKETEKNPVWTEDDCSTNDPDFQDVYREWEERFGCPFTKNEPVEIHYDTDGSSTIFMNNGYALYRWIRGYCAIYKIKET
jgi:hypothetical protein